MFRKIAAIAMVTPAAAVGATRQVFLAAYRALRATILWLTGPNPNGISWLTRPARGGALFLKIL